MGEISNGMNLAVGSTYVPKTIAQILTEVSMMDDIIKKASMLEFHVHEMEKEITKIESFKREFPQCMHFLEDAIEILKKEMLRWKGREKGPVMVEFLPLKSDSEGCGGVNGSFNISEKKRWMRSAHLCSIIPVQYDTNFDSGNQDSVFRQKSSYKGEEGNPRGNLFEGCNLKSRGGAFLPFKRPEKNDREGVDSAYGLESSVDLNVIAGDQQPHEPHQQQPQKKNQRRCWSPELHKRFVDALHQLGGEQAATPKQIKELMNVDGLTNDQVKSHLQKYRLHVRKLSTSSAESLNEGSWLTQDQCGGLANPTVALAYSGSPHGPLHHGGFGKRESTFGGERMEENDEIYKTSCT